MSVAAADATHAGGLLWALQGAPLPPPPPPSMPGPPPTPYAPPPAKRGGPPWLWILLGCGCLLVIVALVGSIWGGTWYYRTKVAPQITKVEQEFKQPSGETTTSGSESGATPGGGSTSEGEQGEPTSTPEPSSSATPQPSRELALKAALEGHADWVGKIVYVSDDLQRVKIWIGPPQSEFTAEVVMEWNGSLSRYLLKEAHPVAGSEAPAGPSGPQPGKDKAVAKALSQCDAGWVAKVMSHNADWTRATIAVGPPASEWVGEIDVKWNGSAYVVTASRGE